MFERCLYFNTNALARKLNTRWDKAFAQYDLTPSHGYLLRLVLERPGLSQQAIADELRLEKSTVARFLTQLSSQGLVTRRSSKVDPRQNAIWPTQKARRKEADLDSLGDELYDTMCRVLGKRDVKAFVVSVRAVTEKL